MRSRHDIERLAERLGTAGMPVAEVARLADEWRDHACDLAEEGRGAGLSEDVAEAAALERLGAVKELERAVLREFRRATFAGRHPMLCFGVSVLPMALCSYVGVIVFSMLLGTALHKWLLGWGIVWHPVVCAAFNIVVPCGLAILYGRAARRRAMSMVWRLVPAVLIAVLASFFQLIIQVDQILSLAPGGPHGKVMLGAEIPHGDLWLAMAALGASLLSSGVIRRMSFRRSAVYNWSKLS